MELFARVCTLDRKWSLILSADFIDFDLQINRLVELDSSIEQVLQFDLFVEPEVNLELHY